jgi:hypothetical protein
MNERDTFSSDRSAAIRTMLTETVKRERGTRPSRRSQRFILASVILSVVIVGTGGTALALNGGLLPAPGPAPVATETAAPTPSATSSPTQEPVRPVAPSVPEVDRSDPAAWIIDFDGIGPVKVGDNLATARLSLNVYTDTTEAESCPGVAMFTAIDAPALWLPLGVDGATISEVSVNDWADHGLDVARSPRTLEGIGIGSSRRDVEAAYPDLPLNDVEVLSPYYSYADGAGRFITIALRDETVVAITVQATPAPASEYCG